MNVNIFMKQFGKLSNTEVVEKIREGQHESIGQEKLLGLLKILPDADEVRKESLMLLFMKQSWNSLIHNFTRPINSFPKIVALELTILTPF